MESSIGPEYETLGMMGTACMIDDPKAVAKANDVANRLGIDTISTGAMVGFAMECFEKGWITTKDTGGLELKWGDPNALIALTESDRPARGFRGEFLPKALCPRQKKSARTPSIAWCIARGSTCRPTTRGHAFLWPPHTPRALAGPAISADRAKTSTWADFSSRKSASKRAW